MNAEELYESRKCDIAALLDWLELELQQHGEYVRKEGLSYAHAGDLGEVRRKLIETLSFLAQQDESDIEDALADMAAGREQAAVREQAEAHEDVAADERPTREQAMDSLREAASVLEGAAGDEVIMPGWDEALLGNRERGIRIASEAIRAHGKTPDEGCRVHLRDLGFLVRYVADMLEE